MKLPKTAKNKIFLRNLRDAGVSTRPRELNKFEKQCFTAQQLATNKQLVQALEDFSPVLQVLYHTMAKLVHVQDVEEIDFAEQLRSLTLQTSDLVVMLLEYFGKLSQPRRDLYEKVTGLQPTPAVQAHGFLTQLEQDSAMEEARRRDLIHQSAMAVAPSNWGGGPNARGGNARGHR